MQNQSNKINNAGKNTGAHSNNTSNSHQSNAHFGSNNTPNNNNNNNSNSNNNNKAAVHNVNSQPLPVSTTPSPYIQSLYQSRKKTRWQRIKLAMFNWIEGIPNDGGIDGPMFQKKKPRRKRAATLQGSVWSQFMGLFQGKAAASSHPKALQNNNQTDDPTGSRLRGISIYDEVRYVFVNVPVTSSLADTSGRPLMRFPPNGIKTTKYTAFSFLPKNLYEQFRRIANFYFLFMSLLQFYGEVQNINPFYGAAPIMIIVFITAIKDGFEDWKRHTSDDSVNNDIVYRLAHYRNVNDRDWHQEPPVVDLEKLKRKALGPSWKKILRRKTWHSILFPRKSLDPAPAENSPVMERIELPQSPDKHIVDISPTDSKDPNSMSMPMEPSQGSSSYPAIQVTVDSPNQTLGSSNNSSPKINTDAKALGTPSTENKSPSKSENLQVPGSNSTSNSSSPLSPTAKVLQACNDSRLKSGWIPIISKHLKVGDIIQLRNNESIPADVVVISTSEPDCLCYIETKNLDGETNLKIKRAPLETSWVQSAEDCHSLEVAIECDPPNINLYNFHGRLCLYNESSSRADDIKITNLSSSGVQIEEKEEGAKEEGEQSSQYIPLTINSLLLRGCVLRNTGFVIGVVIATGIDTKLMLNSGETPSKRSRIERRLNPQVIVNFLIMVVMSAVCSIIFGSIVARYSNQSIPFLYQTNYNFLIGFNTFLSSLILFQNIIPIALYLSVELCKSLQAFFIYSDVEMYYEPTDTPCIPKAWNLSDDLGQIEYIFSDKTGTLTRNVMELKKISVNSIAYGLTETDFDKEINPSTWREEVLHSFGDDPANVPAESFTLEYVKNRMITEMRKILKAALINPKEQTLADPRLFIDLRDNPEQSRGIIDFFRVLALCHTVLAQKPGSGNVQSNANLSDQYFDIVYKAQSPDESALVSAARSLGFTFVCREKDTITIDCLGKIEKYTVLNVLEFNSTRKRMSVIIRKSSGQIILFCKGADSIIYERLANPNSELGTTTLTHLENFAEEGLRTLCLAFRPLEEEQYQLWAEKYAEAANNMEERDAKIDEVADEIERDLILLGATAIEDKLQEGVPETIEILGRAGIKIWVLTGDKMETAINIGFSCNLLQKDMLLMVIKGVDPASVQRQVQDSLEQIFGREDSAARERLNAAALDAGLGFDFNDSNSQGNSRDIKNVPIALIIDGQSLKFALEKESRILFLELACHCKAVICCRVSPLQKAKIVELVKKGKSVMTLAIGDGANDVSMIQAADIGIGIAGEEGVQAVMASDYAIAQFRFLKRLLLVHGRYSYIRTAELTLNAFYKNVIITFVTFWYQFYCAFSAQTVFDFMYTLFYNLLFCNLPVLAIGVFDRDVNAEFSVRVPQLYLRGIQQKAYTLKLFLLYNIDAMYQSIICFFVPMLVYYDSSFAPQGYGDQHTLLGIVIALSVIFCANLYVGMNNYSWNKITLAFILFGIFTSLIITLFYNFATDQNLFGSVPEILIQPTFYLTLVITMFLALFPRVLSKYLQTSYAPEDVDIVREVEKFGLDPKELFSSTMVGSLGGKGKTSPGGAMSTHDNAGVGGGTTGSTLSTSTSTTINNNLTTNASMANRISVPEKTFTKTPAVASSPILPNLPTIDELIVSNNNNNSKALQFPSKRASSSGHHHLTTTANVAATSASNATTANTNANSSLKKKPPTTSILYMRTGKFEKLRGFAFSQEEGMKDVVTGKAFGMAVKSRPELELKKLPRVAVRDKIRFPRSSGGGGTSSSNSSNVNRVGFTAGDPLTIHSFATNNTTNHHFNRATGFSNPNLNGLGIIGPSTSNHNPSNNQNASSLTTNTNSNNNNNTPNNGIIRLDQIRPRILNPNSSNNNAGTSSNSTTNNLPINNLNNNTNNNNANNVNSKDGNNAADKKAGKEGTR